MARATTEDAGGTVRGICSGATLFRRDLHRRDNRKAIRKRKRGTWQAAALSSQLDAVRAREAQLRRRLRAALGIVSRLRPREARRARFLEAVARFKRAAEVASPERTARAILREGGQRWLLTALLERARAEARTR